MASSHVSLSLARAAFLIGLAVATTATVGCGGSAASRPQLGRPVDLVEQVDQKGLTELLNKHHTPNSKEYFLGPGDVIQIQILNLPQGVNAPGADGNEPFEFTLTDSPFITMPMVGAKMVHGKTASQVESELKAAFGDFIRNPELVVSVKSFNQNRVAVLGSVEKADTYPFQFGDTVIDAVFRAGGPAAGGRAGGLAPGRVVKIYREKLSPGERARMPLEDVVKALMVGDRIQTRDEITIPFQDFLVNGKMEYNLPLQPNDIVYIPPGGTVHMRGKVQGPGVVYLGPQVSTLGEAVTDRGGLHWGASNRVEVVREYADGQLVTYDLGIRDILNKKTEDFYLKDGDKVWIRTNIPRYCVWWVTSFINAGVSTGVTGTYNPAN